MSARSGHIRESVGRGQCRCIADKKAELPVFMETRGSPPKCGSLFLLGDGGLPIRLRAAEADNRLCVFAGIET